MWRTARRLVRFFRLPYREKLATLVALLLVITAHVIVRLVPYSRWLAWIRVSGPGRRMRCVRQGLQRRIDPMIVGEAVIRASRVVPASRCLVQAIAAQLLYRASGHRAELRIGVAPTVKGHLRAHAWVELADGSVVIGSIDGLSEYRIFPLTEAAKMRL